MSLETPRLWFTAEEDKACHNATGAEWGGGWVKRKAFGLVYIRHYQTAGSKVGNLQPGCCLPQTDWSLSDGIPD